MFNKNRAFTLIELLICISIVSILMTSAVPAFTQLLDKRKVDVHKQRLVKTLQLARTTAVTNNKKVTLCPTQSGSSCTSNWSSGYLVFIDDNGDREFTNNEEILYQFISTDEKSSVYWRAFGTRSSLQWLQTGITNHQNGSFILCYDNQPEYSRGLYLTKAGRIRFSKDTDGDNIHENSTGSPISC